MINVEIKYSNGHVEKEVIEQVDESTLDSKIEDIISRYIADNPGVSIVSKNVTYTSDEDITVKNMEEYHERRNHEIFIRGGGR